MAFKDLFKTKAERRAYAIGRKHQAAFCKNNRKSSRNASNPLDKYPNWAKHNVLIGDDGAYTGFYRSMRELGYEHEKARDLSLDYYGKEFNDIGLKEHYGISTSPSKRKKK